MALTKLTLASALGTLYGTDGDINYILGTDPIYYEVANRPLKNLAYRDGLLNAKMDEVIDEVNNAYAGTAIVASSESGHAATKADFQTFLKAAHNADGSVKSSAVSGLGAAASDLSKAHRMLDRSLLDTLALSNRTEAPSGFLSVLRLQDRVSSGTTLNFGGMAPLVGAATLRIGATTAQVYGYRINVPQSDVALGTAPATGERQDGVLLEAWREIAHPLRISQAGNATAVASSNQITFDSVDLSTTIVVGDYVDCLNGEYYEITAVTYSGGDTIVATKLPIVTAFADQSTRILYSTPKFYRYGYVGYSGAAFGATGSRTTTSSTDFRYTTASAQHMTIDPRNDEIGVVGVHESGAYWQLRYRFRVVAGVLPETALTVFNSHGTSRRLFAVAAGYTTVQGAASAEKSPYDSALQYRSSQESSSHSSLGDPGAFCELTPSAWSLANGNLPFTTDGVCHFALPVACVHRRNRAAWSLTNPNGSGAYGGTSGRPDGLFYDEVAWKDVLDLRHTVIATERSSLESVYRETLDLLLSGDLATNWEALLVNPDGDNTFSSTFRVYSTRPLLAEGIVGDAAFDSETCVTRRPYCNNGTPSSPDGIRNYYGDSQSIQAAFAVIPDLAADGVTPTTMFAYDASEKTLTIDTTDLQAADITDHDDPSYAYYRPINSGILPYLYWEDGKMVYVSLGDDDSDTLNDSYGDTLAVVIQQGTSCILHSDGTTNGTNGLASVPAVGAVYTSDSGSVPITFRGCDAQISDAPTTAVNYSVTFTGATAPPTGNYTKSTGTGPTNIHLHQYTLPDGTNSIGYGYLAFNTRTAATDGTTYGHQDRVYLGEGYDYASHSTKKIFVTAFIRWAAGSGILSRTPYMNGFRRDGYDHILGVQYFQGSGVGDPVQVMPNSGIGFIPLGTTGLPRGWGMKSGSQGGPCRETSVMGFCQRNAGITPAMISADTQMIRDQCVILDSTTYKMWFIADGDVYYAYGTDGLTWSTPVKVITHTAGAGDEGAGIWFLSVIKSGASTYHMWIITAKLTGEEYVKHVTSTDGVTDWGSRTLCTTLTNFTPTPTTYPVTYKPAAGICVIKDSSTYKMWLGAKNSSDTAVCYADSADGDTWANWQRVFSAGPGLGGSGTQDAWWWFRPACVIKESTYYRLFLFCSPPTQTPEMYEGSAPFLGPEWDEPEPKNCTALAMAFSTDGKNCSHPAIIADFHPTYFYQASFRVIKTDTTYRFWCTHPFSSIPDTGSTNSWSYASPGISGGLLTLRDDSNTGTSMVGVYSTLGSLNIAPGQNDSVIFFYEAPARPQNWSYFGGTLTAGTGTLSYKLLYAPSTCVMSTCGTGHNPPAFDTKRRAGMHVLFTNSYFHYPNNGLWKVTGDELAAVTLHTDSETDPGDRQVLNLDVPLHLIRPSALSTGAFREGYSVAVGSDVSITGLLSGTLASGFLEAGFSIAAYGAGKTAYGDDTKLSLPPPSYITGGFWQDDLIGEGGNLMVVAPVLGVKEGEVIMPITAGVYSRDDSLELPVMAVVPAGRPLLKR